jgi:hypothetical protein
VPSRVGARKVLTPCDLLILVEQFTEAVGAEQQGGEVGRASPAVRSPDVLSRHNDIWFGCVIRSGGGGDAASREQCRPCHLLVRPSPPESPAAGTACSI